MPDTSHPPVQSDQVDVRGPRFAAWVTTAVLLGCLLTAEVSAPAAAALVAFQGLVFATGAALGPRRHPYAVLFARLVAPRLAPSTEREPIAPLRFAQLVGAAFAVVGVAGFTFAPTVGLIATASALMAAFLSAAFGICLGCQLYPLIVRLRVSGPAHVAVAPRS